MTHPRPNLVLCTARNNHLLHWQPSRAQNCSVQSGLLLFWNVYTAPPCGRKLPRPHHAGSTRTNGCVLSIHAQKHAKLSSRPNGASWREWQQSNDLVASTDFCFMYRDASTRQSAVNAFLRADGDIKAAKNLAAKDCSCLVVSQLPISWVKLSIKRLLVCYTPSFARTPPLCEAHPLGRTSRTTTFVC